MQPTDLLNLSKEELVEKLREYDLIYDEAMGTLVMIRSEIITRLDEEHKDGELVSDKELSIRTRITVKLSIEKARELGCTIVKEEVDNAKVIKLYKSGVKFDEGEISVTRYLSVREVQQEEND